MLMCYRGGFGGGFQGVRTFARLITVPFIKNNIFSIYMFLAEQDASLLAKTKQELNYRFSIYAHSRRIGARMSGALLLRCPLRMDRTPGLVKS